MNVQFAVEVDAHCSGPPSPSYFQYPQLSNLETWDPDIDPNLWLLVGFSPIQTSPPSSTKYCPNPDSCPVGYGVASILNFVDYADFKAIKARITVATYSMKTINENGTVTFGLNCPNGNQNATCGAAILTGTQPTLWAEGFNTYVTVTIKKKVTGTCLPLNIVQYFNGPPAPYQCR